ncbi:choline dehydrogenase [Mycobacterium sp. ACS1612]|uniref:GMC family oxidoreductase n=1 Tax=Mycobacterium sp. ACS1612 TaxID=1834117 RepID=UPI0008007FC5|nr:GMC family oxidoreductase N-terminal domain-containing protein [Mycobacterium sp. ACS1612]OBF39450.1 choline dehydrogenase [Mycobacterium sp. ACS1612]
MEPTRQSYDYIVVGGGTAGCVLAARLSEDPTIHVLLIEAGAREPLEAMAVPAAWLSLLGSTAVWGDSGAVNAFTGTRVATPRGRGLGGSSSINGLVFVRGHHTGYDAWTRCGAPGWGFDDLLPYFRRSETATNGDPAVRGVDGPLIVGTPPTPNPMIAAAVEAAVEVGCGRAGDLSSGLEIGFGWPDFNIVNGARQSAADAYLIPAMNRSNLDVVTDALVRRVVVADGRATGVEFKTGGTTATVACTREIVLTAGAIGSAQLLLLSGIGASEHLRAVGVKPVLELPGVGANLQDHPLAWLTYEASQPISSIPANATGEAMGFIRTSLEFDGPDLQFVLHSLPLPVPTLPTPEHGYSIMFSAINPHSRGRIRLAGPDAGMLPEVDPNYLADARDVATMRAGLRLARRIGEGEALAGWRGAEVHPGPHVDDADDSLDEYLRLSLRCYFHYAGTCRMGGDEMAVVDPQLRVRGIEGLRVADASVMPSIVTANTAATVYGIAERAADLIRTQHHT